MATKLRKVVKYNTQCLVVYVETLCAPVHACICKCNRMQTLPSLCTCHVGYTYQYVEFIS